MYIKCKSKRIGGFRRCPAGGGDWNASPQEVSGAQLLFRLLIWVLVTWVCSFVKIRQNLCSLGNIFLNVNYILLKYLSNQKNLFFGQLLMKSVFCKGSVFYRNEAEVGNTNLASPFSKKSCCRFSKPKPFSTDFHPRALCIFHGIAPLLG